MNKKVLLTMIILMVAFLVAIYLAKLISPAWIVGIASTPDIISVGTFVDSHWWIRISIGLIFCFVTLWFYSCAVLRKWYLNWKELIAVFISVFILSLIGEFMSQYSVWANIMVMIIIPTIFKANMIDFAFVCGIHFSAQIFSLGIRDIGLLTPSYNFATLLILAVDVYIWLGLLYAFQNYRKKEE